jgi:hypothetical protein
MRYSADYLYKLLPAIYRTRDAELGYPLRELVDVLAREAGVLEESIEQLYDHQFIETAADWAAPYIGSLIGYRPLHGSVPSVASPRAEVANTIGYRRRLGTASVLEQLARDVTGWPARAVEYTFLTGTFQRMNHVRTGHHIAPDLRSWRGLEQIGRAFDPFPRLADMRPIARREGRHNLANVGIHLWRIGAASRTAAPLLMLDNRRGLVSPLGAPWQMVTNAQPEDDIAALATPLNVPLPITRRMLHADLTGENGAPPPRALYGRTAPGGAVQSLVVTLDGVELAASEVRAAHLGDDGATWANMPAAGGKVSIDPVLGRIALPPDRLGTLGITCHRGTPAEIGGGEYDRARNFRAEDADHPLLRVPSAQHATIASALAALPATGGIVEIASNARFAEALAIVAGADAEIELRAANGFQPHLALPSDLRITGGLRSAVTLDGLLISGAAVCAPEDGASRLERLTLRHCTLVPGRGLTGAGAPTDPGVPAVLIPRHQLRLEIRSTMCGGLRTAATGTCTIADSIVDSAAGNAFDSPAAIVYAAPDSIGFGAVLTIERSTLIGKIRTRRFELVTSAILHARLGPGDAWAYPVQAEQRQKGCIRFSFVPHTAVVPRRYRCQPQLATAEAIKRREEAKGAPLGALEQQRIAQETRRRVVPAFASLRFGRPEYGLLRVNAAREIGTGGEDESEMGAFHALYAPQRLANITIRLDEYLRFALQAGIFIE